MRLRRHDSWLGLVLFVLLLMGCSKPLVYELGGRSQGEFDRDSRTCQRDSQNEADRQTCMKGHGWRLAEPAKN